MPSALRNSIFSTIVLLILNTNVVAALVTKSMPMTTLSPHNFQLFRNQEQQHRPRDFGLNMAAASTDKPMVIPSGADFDAYLGSYSSCTFETPPTILLCSLPSDFPVGTFYRNGGCKFQSDDGTRVIHPFDADGMICAVTFDPENQRLLFRNKYVETEGYIQDKTTGRMTQRGIFGTMRSGGLWANIFRTDFKNVANTNVLYVGDKLYALWEGGKPYVLNPLTLKNLRAPGGVGETDLNGLLVDRKSTMSAHPRYDPQRDVWVTFGYNFDPLTGQTKVDLYELDNKDFGSTRQGRLQIIKDGPALIHDFILTENYLLFNLNDASVSPEAVFKAVLGGGAFAEAIALDEDTTETQFVLIPRSLFDKVDDGSDLVMDVMNDDRIKKISVPFHANFHFSNGFEDEDGQIIFDTVQTIQRDLLRPPSKAGVPVIENDLLWSWLYPSTLTRYSLDPILETLSIGVAPRLLTKRPTEFPSIPRQLSTRRHRFVYAGGSHNEIPGSSPNSRRSGPQTGSIMKVDTEDPSKTEIYCLETFEFVGESVFVEKVGKDVTNRKEEDGGYLVTYVTNGRDKTTDLVIFDVEGPGSLSQGPIARIPLPTFIPQGLHGCFARGVTFDFSPVLFGNYDA